MDPREQASLVRAVQWIGAHLDRFDPCAGGGGIADGRWQRPAELAAAALLLTKTGFGRMDGPVSTEVQAIRSNLCRLQEQQTYADQILRVPSRFALFCSMYGVLRLLGHEDFAIRDRLMRALEAGYAECTEREPYRMMDVRLALEWADLSHPWPGWDELIASSLLGRPPSASTLGEASTYALTHDVMFLTAFGTRPFPRSAVGVDALRTTLLTLLVGTCQEKHWDLVGELLVCWYTMGLAPTLPSERALDALLAVQQDDGSFPGPERRPSHPLADEAGDEDSAFRRCYHTTLVAILALCTRRLSACVGSSTHFRRDGASPRRPQSPDVSVVLTAAASWFQQTLELAEQHGDLGPTTASRLLTGLWVCEELNALPPACFREAAERVWRTLREPPSKPSGRPVPAALMIITFGVLRRQGLHVPVLDDFVSRACRALADVHTSDARSDLRLCEKRVLLNALGLQPPPLLLSRDELLAATDAVRLPLARADLDELLLHINSFTGYGALSGPEPIEEATLDLLRALADNALRTYDLEAGSRLLRALCYVGGGARSEPLAMFLCRHQRPEGSFGYLGGEEAAMPSGKLNLRTELELPFTLAATWAVAEASHPSWRLIKTLSSVW